MSFEQRRRSRGREGLRAWTVRAWWHRIREHDEEYYRLTELRCWVFLAAVAAAGYATDDTPGLSLGDVITYVGAALAAGWAVCWPLPRRRR